LTRILARGARLGSSGSVPSRPQTIQDPERTRALSPRRTPKGGGTRANSSGCGRRDARRVSVFAQHLDPQHESILAELLGRATRLPVEFAKDGQPIERDHVYVMPRNAGLLVEDGKLRLVAGEPRSSRLPINALLTSLAEDQRENAVGIVLSGTGSDGALGMAAVKRHGGWTFAQLPADARYESMPQAAIATGVVDEVLPVEQLPAALAKLLAERRQHPGESARGETEGLREAFEILGRKTGHDFSRYKRTTILRRFQRRMAATGASTVRDYAALLDREEDEVRRLSDDLMINVTSFFRDGEPFEKLERTVIPDVLERHATDGVRTWVAGCSSGEEAYSVAILFREKTDPLVRRLLFQPFAQGHNTLDRAQGGLGLGLALVKGLVELHEGTVEAQSAGKGAGTEIVVRLPLAKGRGASAETPPVRPSPRRILVIEDNADAAESLRLALALEGHEVETALDGPQGMEKAREFAPHVVLCDIGLPGMDGYQVAKALRAAPESRRAFLVAVTGYAREEDQERARDAGFDAHLAKPPRSSSSKRSSTARPHDHLTPPASRRAARPSAPGFRRGARARLPAHPAEQPAAQGRSGPAGARPQAAGTPRDWVGGCHGSPTAGTSYRPL
jgi:chemotaxis response regulator CheB